MQYPKLKHLLIPLSSLLALIVAAILLNSGIQDMSNTDIQLNLSGLWKMGFGSVDARTIINQISSASGTRELFYNVLLANLPQTILSFLYLTYNSIFTTMLAADEWSGFSYQRKPLRVTSPIGSQRSTYFLQLPYKYSIPLLAASGILHWLVSQSIFLARIEVIKDSYNPSKLVSRCGYSCIAIIFVLFVAGCMLLGAVAIGFRRYKGNAPLVSTCSAAISAACHRPTDDEGSELLPLQWGVVTWDGNRKFGHCSLSSQGVSAPVLGFLYAGEVNYFSDLF
jgi:hypothetical protein